ncbi:calcium-binding protein [Rubinisphaera margarita]|uniref:calcium-binding protein n=1 Tax=Rubinisphaera margarita TaxID=2909586 RepID=UPI001EE953DF|nr:hypothetical protein [Rubinisphaera margarita]MCG6158257.1 hypothetical protein [Rubinisphaera margarita]
MRAHKSLFHTLFASPSKRSHQIRLAPGLAEVLEARDLLSSTATLSHGVLNITGDNDADHVNVSQKNGSIVVTDHMTNQQSTFRASSVSKILFQGNGGDDVFSNDTSKRSEAHGGDGNDELRGGSDNDLFYGGSGHDRLYGYGGHDRLEGGDGNDLIDGGIAGFHKLSDYFTLQVLKGGNGDDVIHSNAILDAVTPGAGADLLFADSYSVLTTKLKSSEMETLVGDDVIARESTTALYVRHAGDTLDLIGSSGIMSLKASEGWTLTGKKYQGHGVISIVSPRGGELPISVSGMEVDTLIQGQERLTFTFAGHKFTYTTKGNPNALRRIATATITMPSLSGLPSNLIDLARDMGISLPSGSDPVQFAIKSGAEIRKTHSSLPLESGKPYLVLEIDRGSHVSVGGITGGDNGQGVTIVMEPGDETVFVKFPGENGETFTVGASRLGRILYTPAAQPDNFRGTLSGHLFAAVDGITIKQLGVTASGSITLDLTEGTDVSPDFSTALWNAVLIEKVLDRDFSDLNIGINGRLNFNEGIDQYVKINGLPLSVNLPLASGSIIYKGAAETLYFRAQTENPFSGTVLSHVPFVRGTQGDIDGVIRRLTSSPSVNITGLVHNSISKTQFVLTNSTLEIRSNVKVLGTGVTMFAHADFATQTVSATGDFTIKAPAGLFGFKPSASVAVRGTSSLSADSLSATVSARAMGVHLGTIHTSLSDIDSAVTDLLKNIASHNILFNTLGDIAHSAIKGIGYVDSIGSKALDYAWANATNIATGRFVVRFGKDGVNEVLQAPAEVQDVAEWLSGKAGENLKKGLYFASNAGKLGWAATKDAADKAVGLAEDVAGEITSLGGLL